MAPQQIAMTQRATARAIAAAPEQAAGPGLCRRPGLRRWQGARPRRGMPRSRTGRPPASLAPMMRRSASRPAAARERRWLRPSIAAATVTAIVVGVTASIGSGEGRRTVPHPVATRSRVTDPVATTSHAAAHAAAHASSRRRRSMRPSCVGARRVRCSCARTTPRVCARAARVNSRRARSIDLDAPAIRGCECDRDLVASTLG